MDFTVDSKALKAGLKTVITFLENQTKDVGITAKKDAIILESGYGGAYITQRIEAEVEKEGKVCIDASALSSLRLNQKVTTIRVKENSIHIRSGSFSSTLNAVLPMSRIKEIRPKKLIDTTHEFSAPAFKNGLSFLSFTPILAQPEDSNVKIVIEKKKLFMITHDDYRGVYYSTSIKAEPLECLMSKSKLWSILSFLDGKIQFGVTKKKVRFRDEKGLDCQTPLLQGKANVNDVVSKIDALLETDPDFSFRVTPKKFYEATANPASIYKSEDGATLVAEINKKKKKLTISMNAHVGKASDSVDLLSVSAKKDCSFKTMDKTLLDALKIVATNVPEVCEVRFFRNLMVVMGENGYKVRYIMSLVQDD